MNLMRIILINVGITLLLIPIIYQSIPMLAEKITLYRVQKSIQSQEQGASLFNEKIRVVKTESVESGSGVGSNIYLSLWYDCRETDLLITGNIPDMQHWSIVPYDIGTSYPLNSWVELDSIITDEQMNYTVKVSSNKLDEDNFINVTDSPVGLLLFRYTNPLDLSESIRELPEVEPIPRNS